MDRLNDLEKILTAARDLGKNLQDDIDKLRAENEKLTAETKRLQTENEKLKSDSDSLLDEMETLENVVKDLRTANETFGVNLNKLMGQLNTAINDSHEKFMAQINLLMRDEFQKFLTEYMSKINATAKNNQSAPAEKNTGKKKDVDAVKETSLVQAELKTEIVEEEKIFVPAENAAPKPKMVYADFYAEEAVD